MPLFLARIILGPNSRVWFVGGKLLLELNRVLRPGGYFVWSATPVYRNDAEDVGIWKGRFSCFFQFICGFGKKRKEKKRY